MMATSMEGAHRHHMFAVTVIKNKKILVHNRLIRVSEDTNFDLILRSSRMDYSTMRDNHGRGDLSQSRRDYSTMMDNHGRGDRSQSRGRNTYGYRSQSRRRSSSREPLLHAK